MRHERAISLKDATMLKKQKGRPPIETANRLEEDEGSSLFARVSRSQLPKYDKSTGGWNEKIEIGWLECWMQNLGK